MTFKPSKDFDKIIRRAVQPQMDQRATAWTAITDAVLAEHGGKSADEIEPVLREQLGAAGVPLDQVDLGLFAETISRGERVIFNSPPVS